jgi:hypothetical protein
VLNVFTRHLHLAPRTAHLEITSAEWPLLSSAPGALLLKVLPPSAEEHRLTDIYRKRCPEGLAAELGKF